MRFRSVPHAAIEGIPRYHLETLGERHQRDTVVVSTKKVIY